MWKTKITEITNYPEKESHYSRKISGANNVSPSSIFRTGSSGPQKQTIGWYSCSCGKGFSSGLVLDPFAGAGTTLLVAHKMGYDWLGIELVKKYCGITEKRITRHGKTRLDGFLETGEGMP